MHPNLFYNYRPKEVISDGVSVYDFLGGRVNSMFKRGLERSVKPKGTSFLPGYPSPSEWTVDWIACLIAAELAESKFNIIELGAGYGQWTVASILAYKDLNPSSPVSAMAVEADKVHFDWLNQHVSTNLSILSDVNIQLINAAAGFDGSVEFPVIDDPAGNYGAAYLSSPHTNSSLRVDCLSLSRIFRLFNEQKIDLLHVDIQGAELDLLADIDVGAILDRTHVAFFGTHRDEATHSRVKESLEMAGMKILIEWPRNSLVSTDFGEITTTDGALLAVNQKLFSNAKTLLGAPR